MKIYLRILRYAPNLKSLVLKFFLFAVLSVAFNMAFLGMIQPMLNILFDQVTVKQISLPTNLSFEYPAIVIQNYFAKIMSHGRTVALIFICLFIIVSVFLSVMFRYFERTTASRIKVDVVKNMRMKIFDRVTLFNIGFFNNQRKGDLVSRFTNDIGEVEGAVLNGTKAFKEPITIIGYIIVLFAISVKLTLVTLFVIPIIGGAISEIIRRLRKKAIQSQESMGRIVNILDETISGMRVILAFNARNFILKKLDSETTFHRKVNLSISRKNELASPLSEFLGAIIISIVIIYGGQLVTGGEMKAATFMAYLAFYVSMIQPAKNFSNGITSIQKGTISAQRIFDVIDLEPAIKNKPNAQHLTEFKHNIEFKNATFAYDKEPVLQNLNLKIEKGKTIALVGPSGGGKSTLADLVPRFYDPTDGEILIDGVNIKDYDIESLRKHMGVVTQESILFNDTIFNNIAFGMENMKEEDVIQAAKIANAHEFIIQTENGYQTLIGERGSKLSGGQRQRLSIARAVLKNPPILILDEATSALDSESERLVQDALTRLMEHRTSIVIAHRLSTIQHADEIIVIQNGHIVERGTHDNLVLQGGLYKKLNEMQSRK
jgi:subfamily B ATP-binding cassette protein MsbA